jgi:phasin family protein
VKERAMAGKMENLNELNRKNMEAAMRLAQLSFENSQRVMALQIELARELFNDGVENARAQSSAKDPQEVLRLRAEYAQETARKMMAVAQQVAEIGNDARVAFSHLLTEQLASGSHEMADAFQGFFKSLPGQNPNMMEMMQQAMNTANSAFEQIAKATTASFTGMTELAQKSTAKKK